MPPKPTSGLSAENIVEGGRQRKRIKLVDHKGDASAADQSSSSIASNDAAGSSSAGAGGHGAQGDAETAFIQGKQLLEVILNALDPENYLIAEPFMRLPSSELYPDYYQVIKRPLSLEEVVDKLHARSYTSLDDLRQDCETICNNAKRYNQKESTIWVLAKRLHALVKDTHISLVEDGAVPEALTPATVTHDPSDPDVVRHFLDGGRPRKRIRLVESAKLSTVAAASPAPSAVSEVNNAHNGPADEDPKKVFKQGIQLLEVLLNALDPDRFLIAEPFMTLPSRELYPDYYQIIKRPIAFEEIVDKLHERSYKSLDELKHDCETICNNAKRYNLRDSTIWVLAKRLHSLVKDAHAGLVENGAVPSELRPAAVMHNPSDLQVVRKFDPNAGMEDDAEDEEGESGEVKGKGGRKGAKGKLAKGKEIQEEPEDMSAVLDCATAPGGKTKITIRPPKKSLDSAAVSSGAFASADGLKAQEEQAKVKGNDPARGAAIAPAEGSSFSEQDIGREVKLGALEVQAASPISAGECNQDRKEKNGTEEVQQGVQLASTGLAVSSVGFGSKQKDPEKERDKEKEKEMSRNVARGKYLKVALKAWLKSVQDLVRPDGSSVTEFFQSLPSKSEYPDYYKVIPKPVSLYEIESKMQSKTFMNGYALHKDLMQMLDNAQFYNEEGSLVWLDAQRIRLHIEQKAVPQFLSEGFTLNEEDVRNSAVPGELGVVRHGDAKSRDSSEHKLKQRLHRLNQEKERQGTPTTPGDTSYSSIGGLSPTQLLPPSMSPSKLPPQYAVRPQPPLPPPHQQLKQMQRQKSATQTPQPHTTTVVGAQPQRLLPVPSPQMIHGAGPSPYPAHTSILPPGVQFPPVPGIGPPFSHPTTFPTGSLPFGQSPIGGSASQPGSYPSTPMHGFPHFGQQRPGMLPPGFPSLHGYGAGPSGLAHAMSFSSPQATPGAPGYAPFGTPGHPGMASLSMDQDVPPPEEVQAQAPPPALRPASYFAQIINPVVPWALNGIRRPHAIPFFLIDVQWRQVGAPRTLEKYTAEIVHETIVVDSSRLKQHMIRVRKGQHVATRRRQPGKLELASVKIRFVLREFDDPDAQTPISERPKSNGPGGEDDNNSIECLNAQDPAEHRNKLDFLVNVMQDGAQVGKLRRGVIEAPGEINGTHEKVERDGVQNSWASIVFEPKLKVGLNTMDIDVEPSPPCPELCALIVDESAPVELRDRAKVLKLLKERYRLFLYV